MRTLRTRTLGTLARHGLRCNQGRAEPMRVALTIMVADPGWQRLCSFVCLRATRPAFPWSTMSTVKPPRDDKNSSAGRNSRNTVSGPATLGDATESSDDLVSKFAGTQELASRMSHNATKAD